jgi:hypothetical protein
MEFSQLLLIHKDNNNNNTYIHARIKFFKYIE